MPLILTLFCILAIISSYKIYKSALNPIIFLFLPWVVNIPLSTLGLYGLDVPEIKTYIIIFIGLLSYYLGAIIHHYMKVSGIRPFKYNVPLNPNIRSTKLNYPFIVILCIITISYLIYMATTVIPMLLDGRGLDYIRALVVAEEYNEIRTSSFTIIIKNFIATPTVYLMIAIFPILIFNTKRMTWANMFIIIIVPVMIVLWVLTTGGRSIILWFVIYFIAVYVFQRESKFNKKKKILSLKSKISITIGLILLMIFLVETTFSRKGSDVSIMRQIVIYFVAPLKLFDYHRIVVDTTYNSYISYGSASFYGLLYPVIFLLRTLGIISPTNEFIYLARYLSFDSLNRSVQIGENFYMNAFATFFYQPYLDGRLFGVLLICGLFGYVNDMFFQKIKFNNKYLLLYLLMLQKMIFSFVRFYFTQPAQAMTFIYAIFAIKYIDYDKPAYRHERKIKVTKFNNNRHTPM